MGSLNENGYSKVFHSAKSFLAHREAYRIWKGPIEDGMSIDHTCRVVSCINPMHLDKCTRAENCNRERSRHLFCKKNLHVMSEDNIFYLKKGARAGWRMCKACTLARNSAWRTANPQRIKAFVKQDMERHGEKRRADKRAHYAKNRERLCAKQRAYDKMVYWKKKADRAGIPVADAHRGAV